jgi:large subunit ribosomal protein L13
LVVRTYQQTTAQTDHRWFIVDAAGQRLGTLAVNVARALSGRDKPTWTPHIDDGDHVIVVNAAKIELGGNKWNLNVYAGAEHPHDAQKPAPLPVSR